MALRTECDRCKAIKDERPGFASTWLAGDYRVGSDREVHFDLCPGCRAKFETWTRVREVRGQETAAAVAEVEGGASP